MRQCAGAKTERTLLRELHDVGCILVPAVKLNLHIDAGVGWSPNLDRADLRLDAAKCVVVVHRHPNKGTRTAEVGIFAESVAGQILATVDNTGALKGERCNGFDSVWC